MAVDIGKLAQQPPIDHRLPRLSIAAPYGLMLAPTAVFSVPVGMFVDRFGPRPIGLVGVLLLIALVVALFL